MARLRAPTQAFRNFWSILLGFVIGGLNNLVVLPWAFAGDLDDWGLIRVVTAWASLLSPIVLFGAPAAMNRYSGKMSALEKVPQLIGTLIWPPIALFSIFVLLPALVFPEGISDMLNLEGKNRSAVLPIAILAGVLTAQLFLAGFLSTKLKTALSTFVKETVFKVGYLGLALSLGLGWIGNAAFLPAYVALNVFIFLLLLLQSLANNFRIDFRGIGSSRELREIRKYSGALVIGGGAWVILNQTEVLMIGNLIGLSQVPIFTVASFIATVASIPIRASQRILIPLISEALHQKDQGQIQQLTNLSHRHLLLSSGWILTCIWVASPQISALLPPEFQGLALIILVIGLSKTIQSASNGSTILISQSDHYKYMVRVNWVAAILAIPLSLLFISERGLDLGILGAALATFVSFSVSALLRQVIVWRIWKRVIPEYRSFVAVLVLVIPAVVLVQWNPSWPPLLTLFTKSALVTGWTALAAVKLNLIPEGLEFAVQKAPWLSKWI